MSPWARSRVPGATMPRAGASSGHTCEPQPGSATLQGIVPARLRLPRSHRAATPPGLSFGMEGAAGKGAGTGTGLWDGVAVSVLGGVTAPGRGELRARGSGFSSLGCRQG